VIKWFVRLSIVLVFLAAILWLTSKIVEQKVVEQALTALNQNIDVPVYISEVNFSLLKEFPNATLQLKDVTLLPAKAFSSQCFQNVQTDTLLYIRDVYLSLNIPALLKHQISLSKITIKSGFVNLLVDEKGRSNYAILKKINYKKQDTSQVSFSFMLNQIACSQLQINYQNLYKKTTANWFIPNYQLKGAFYKDSYAVSTKGKILLQEFRLNQQYLHLQTPAELETNLQIDDKTISLQKSGIIINGQKIDIEGSVLTQPKLSIHLNVSSKGIVLSKLKDLFVMPGALVFDFDGLFAFKALVNGEMSETKTPQIQVNFGLVQGSFKNNFIAINKGIQFEGSFSNGYEQRAKTSVLTLQKLAVLHKNSKLNARLQIQNLLSPEFDLKASLDANLADFTSYINYQHLETLDGHFYGNLRSQGAFNLNDSLAMNTLLAMNHSGSFTLEQMTFDNKTLNLFLEKADLQLHDNSLWMNHMQGSVQQTAFAGKLYLPGLLKVLTNKKKPLVFVADLTCADIHYSSFEPLFASTNQDATAQEFWPIRIDADLQAASFTYQAMFAQELKTQFNYENNHIKLNNLSFKALEGTAQASVDYLFADTKNSFLKVDGQLTRVDINKLFTTFNNFDQEVLTNKNIQGKLTSNFEFECSFENQKFIPASIEYLGHVRIDQGKLMAFKPISEVSKFAEIDELKNISFSTLENDLLISRSNIYIPKMEISSNAFDLSIAGQQNFNGDYLYHLQIYLSDFVSGKSKHLQKQQTEFGTIEDDGYGRTRLFIVAESKNGKSTVNVDKEAIKQNLKKGLSDEKRELKKIFQEEFGWFKKDTTLKKEPLKKQKPAFTIEWDEE
jgi:hypothetical protein